MPNAKKKDRIKRLTTWSSCGKIGFSKLFL